MGRSAIEITLTLNGAPVRAEVAPNELLLDFLRDRQGLTGTKRSCEVQVCGACTVLVDGAPVSSCCYLAYDTHAREVLTIEGLSERPVFALLLDAFTSHAAVQCGFCTPGMLLTIAALLESGELSSESEARVNLSGNLCRCTGYRSVLDAVQAIVVGYRP